MTFAWAVILLVILAAIAGSAAVIGSPIYAIPIVVVCAILAVVVLLLLRARAARLAIARERASVEFADEDYDTLAPRPEHTHGSVKRGPTRPPGATP
jgi:hypothetical protein